MGRERGSGTGWLALPLAASVMGLLFHRSSHAAGDEVVAGGGAGGAAPSPLSTDLAVPGQGGGLLAAAPLAAALPLAAAAGAATPATPGAGPVPRLEIAAVTPGEAQAAGRDGPLAAGGEPGAEPAAGIAIQLATAPAFPAVALPDQSSEALPTPVTAPPPGPVGIVVEGGDEGETITGTERDDLLIGGAGDDVIHAGAGNDTVRGGAGDDLIFGEAGDDILAGGDGNDEIHGGPGNDQLDGGAGDDRLHGGAGDDILAGGPGDDWLDGGPGRDLLDGGDGNDVMVVDRWDDLARNDVWRPGVNTLRVTDDYAGSVARDFGWLNPSGHTTFAIGTDIDRPLPDGAHGFKQQVHAGIQNVALEGDAPHHVVGDGRANTILGNDGANRLWGGAGDDHLLGGAGDDMLWGGEGDDLLEGGPGDDLLYGGAGDDTYVLGLFDSGVDTIFDHEGSNRLQLLGADAELVSARLEGADLHLAYAGVDRAVIQGYVGNEAAYAGIDLGQGLRPLDDFLPAEGEFVDPAIAATDAFLSGELWVLEPDLAATLGGADPAGGGAAPARPGEEVEAALR